MALALNPKSTRLGIYKVALMATLASYLIFNPAPVLADDNVGTGLPDFASFSVSVLNGQANELRGVYVANVLAMPIVQQPQGNLGFVSSTENTITQFSMAADAGNVGLLAHNYLAGSLFVNLAPGQEVNLIYGDGRVESFTITRVLQYQALDPYSPYSEFRDLQTNVLLTAEQLFGQVYRGERHVTFQTCIAAEGNSSWGRLFVIAEPKPHLVADSFYFLERGMR